MTYERGYGASPRGKGPCEEAGCLHVGAFRGLCQKHHSALGLLGRLMRYVEKQEDGCWIWTGPTIHGYGQRSVRGEDGKQHSRKAHRLVYELMVGPIPDGYQLDHLCQVTRCVNPVHLEAVTPQVNTLRSSAPAAIAVQTNTCKRGHELSATNAKVLPGGNRVCRACLRIRAYELRTGKPHPARDDTEARLRWTSTSLNIVAGVKA